MPITLPVLDDRNYEQILEEALRRIPVYTPEWTSYRVESDPGVTIVQLFAFLTESLLYRANRIPELNRLKFLQLLNVPLRPASAADGLIAIQNERGPSRPCCWNKVWSSTPAMCRSSRVIRSTCCRSRRRSFISGPSPTPTPPTPATVRSTRPVRGAAGRRG